MFDSLINTMSAWTNATIGYASWGLRAPVKFFAPSLSAFPTLTIGQRNVYDAVVSPTLKTFISGGDEPHATAVINAIDANPDLLHVWTVLEQTAGDGATHFDKFLTLDATEAKNYLEIITGANDGSLTATALNRANIKAKLNTLPANKVKQFLSDFPAAQAAKLTDLDANDTLIDTWRDVQYLNPLNIANTRVNIQFLKSIQWMKNTGDGQKVQHHILAGDIKYHKNTGAMTGITGVHHISAMKKAAVGVDTLNDVQVTGAIVPLAGGFYQQKVQIFDGTIWKDKIGNSGMASFFPNTWTIDQIIEEIAYAETNVLYQNNALISIDSDLGIGFPPAVPITVSGNLNLTANIPTASNTAVVGNVKLPAVVMGNPVGLPLPCHPEGKTHNVKAVAAIAVSVDTCPLVAATPTTGTITFLGNTYRGQTTNGGNCMMYLYNPNDATKIIGSAFPCP